MTIKRIIPLEEVAETDHYDDMADLAVIFNHEIVEDDQGTWRWKENKLISMFQGNHGGAMFHTPPMWRGAMVNQMHGPGSIDLNWLAGAVFTNEIPLEEYMKFNMQIGYSLGGYAEVFGQREVTEYGIEYLSPPPDDHNFDEEYYQTPLEYMRIKYKGQVLKI